MSLALVLAGGGARGAYEAGVMRYVMGTLPRVAGEAVIPRIICGTSVGALNGTYLAGGLGDPGVALKLSAMWRNMTIGRIYRFVALDLLRSPLRLFGKKISDSAALLDPEPLYDWVRSEFPWRGLRETVRRSDFGGLVLTATDMTAGNPVNFIDAWQHQGPATLGGLYRPDPSLRVIHTPLRVEHCLASCAIPFLFPPIHVDGRPMIDGSVRQNTPLGPALRMGADRVLVVGVKRPHSQRVRQHAADPDDNIGFAQMAGKALNAMMLDPIERDLELVDLFNQIFAYGENSLGPQFLEGLNKTVGKRNQTSFRTVQALEIRPSLDLGAVAAEVFQEAEVEASRPTRMLLNAIANRESPSEADLLSYLLFDKSFTAQIEQLGFEDARYKEEEIARFLRLGSPTD